MFHSSLTFSLHHEVAVFILQKFNLFISEFLCFSGQGENKQNNSAKAECLHWIYHSCVISLTMSKLSVYHFLSLLSSLKLVAIHTYSRWQY